MGFTSSVMLHKHGALQTDYEVSPLKAERVRQGIALADMLDQILAMTENANCSNHLDDC